MGLRFNLLILLCLIFTACDQENTRLFDEQASSNTPNFLDLSDDTLTKHEDTEVKKVANNSTITIPEKLLRSSVTIIASNGENEIIGLGSGVFVDANLIATNHHVIEVGKSFKIKLNEGEFEYPATVYAVDELHDVAILRIERAFPDYTLQLNIGLPSIGTHILVAGTPEGLGGTVSEGIISSIRRDKETDHDLLQISAPISPGSSGGPVINGSGELVGIAVAALATKRAQNLNFAVPSKYIQKLLMK